MERVMREEGFTGITWLALDAAKGHEELLEHWGGPVARSDGAGAEAVGVAPVVRLHATKPL